MSVKDLDTLMTLCLRRGVMQAEFHPDGSIKALAFNPMAFEAPQGKAIPVEKDTTEPDEPVKKDPDADTVIQMLRATEGRG